MAERPTPGGSDGTWGTEYNAHLAVSLAADGKVLDGAVFSTSAAPTVDAGVANKKYVDDQNVDHVGQIKAWARIQGDASIDASYNVSGVVRNSAGDYTVSWDTNFGSTSYVVVGTSRAGSFSNVVVTTVLAGSADIILRNASGTKTDADFMIMAMGAQ